MNNPVKVIDQKELINAIVSFIQHDELEEVLEKTIENQRPEDLYEEQGDSVDVEECLDYALTICGMFYNNHSLELDYELKEIFIPDIDIELQEKIAKEKAAEGYRSYIIGDDVFAFKTKKCIDSNEAIYKRWHMIKYVSNGNPEEEYLEDYCSKPEQ